MNYNYRCKISIQDFNLNFSSILFRCTSGIPRQNFSNENEEISATDFENILCNDLNSYNWKTAKCFIILWRLSLEKNLALLNRIDVVRRRMPFSKKMMMTSGLNVNSISLMIHIYIWPLYGSQQSSQKRLTLVSLSLIKIVRWYFTFISLFFSNRSQIINVNK